MNTLKRINFRLFSYPAENKLFMKRVFPHLFLTLGLKLIFDTIPFHRNYIVYQYERSKLDKVQSDA